MTKRVVISGASGLIGGALTSFLTGRGDDVARLVRREARFPSEIRWDPDSGHLDPAVLDGVDVIVNLNGAGVGDHRWTAEYKAVIRSSRVNSTTTLATAAAATSTATSGVRLVNASAVGYYGDRGDEVLTEDSPAGEGFLAGVVADWEAATAPARDAGLSVAMARTGIVLAPHGGAMEPVLRLARLGLAGPFGRGRAWWPWITLADEIRALTHLIDNPDLVGPINIVGPLPARQGEVVRTLAAALHRPAVLPVPPLALRIVLGEFAGDVLASLRAVPTRLQESGFRHEHDSLSAAMGWLVADL